MTWSYSGNPGASDLDTVRFAVGDTDTNEQLLSDEEINYLASVAPNTTIAASAAAKAIAAKFACQVDERVGDMQLSLSQRVRHFLQLAKDLSGSSGAVPFTSSSVVGAADAVHKPLFTLREEGITEEGGFGVSSEDT